MIRKLKKKDRVVLEDMIENVINCRTPESFKELNSYAIGLQRKGYNIELYRSVEESLLPIINRYPTEQ